MDKKEEEIDISALKWEEKEIIYALLKHFQQSQQAINLLATHNIPFFKDNE